MVVNPASTADHRCLNGVDFWFCGAPCAQQFDENPSKFVHST